MLVRLLYASRTDPSMNDAGLHAILVLSGVSTRELAERYPYRPSRIVASVADLVEELGVDAPVPGAAQP